MSRAGRRLLGAATIAVLLVMGWMAMARGGPAPEPDQNCAFWPCFHSFRAAERWLVDHRDVGAVLVRPAWAPCAVLRENRSAERDGYCIGEDGGMRFYVLGENGNIMFLGVRP